MGEVDPKVAGIVDKAVSGEPIERSEARYLCDIEPYSKESFLLKWANHRLLEESSGGIGLIYSQIGVDANPCPGGCWYCSFAAQSNDWTGRAELPFDVVIEYCRILDEGGVHLISLMTTAGYDFDQYIDLLTVVRGAISENIAIMVNIGDFDLEGAKRLKAAGADVVYHAVRVGEGQITDLDPADRWETIDASVDAGIRISSGVGPLYRGVDKDAVVERMFDVAPYNPVCSGVTGLVNVPGTRMESYETISMEERRIYACIWQLVAGRGRAPFGGENTRWVDAGANPRGTVMLVGRERILADIDRARKELTGEGWNVPETRMPFCEIY